MTTHHSATTDSTRVDQTELTQYLPAMPSAALIEFGRRAASALNQYE
ncbi:hypothetical protein [Halobacterium yunchengense]